MDKARAVKLLDDTFKKNFDIDQFSKFTKELFNDIQINIQDKTQYIANQFKEYIAECKKIADYKDASKKSMEILAVKLKRTSSRDRARTMQRNFISSWLSKQEIDAALVAFYGDDNEDWRFSYVKMEYNLIKNEDEKVIIAKELTPAKRYSFLVGTNEPNHTCQRQFLDLVIEESTNPSISQIEQAFSVEKVTKEFFEKYKELTINLKDALDEILPKNQRIRTEFDRKGISAIDFSKKLMGQVVFIYFLQKKGWLGVQKRSDGTFDEWGTGPRNFLRKLFDKKIVPYDNFFNDMLEPLFYEALATDRSTDNDYYSRFKCKIPFLNGGLFEPLNDYDWTGTDISIPNELFSNSIKTQTGDVGTGILDVFDRYNFTVKEDDPIDKDVAVDPEMLGKVFENLLDVKERKDKGAFYTPREIVHYMCQQSLINYLETNTQDIPRDDIERFVQYGDIALDQTIKSLAQKERYNGKSYVDEKLLVPKSITDNYQKIDKLLQDIKIVDPAVGSGAFPVGMMNEIVKARSILTIFFSPDEQESRTEYNLKRQCIENCLYGVDIDPSAVEIAKLRFWLSLIVGEEKRENIQPLPNLDHKIMCGNSLLEEFEGIKLFDERFLDEMISKSPTEIEIEGIEEQILHLKEVLSDAKFGDQRPEIRKYVEELENLQKRKASVEKNLEREKRLKEKETQITIDQALERRIKESQIKLSQLRRLQKEFFNEQNRNKKKKLREEIDKIEWELIEATLEGQGHEEALAKLEQYKKTNVKPFFLWKLYFAEVFQRDNPGFDVVIANPPYVKEYTNRHAFEGLRDSPYYQGKMDIWYFFACEGVDLVRDDGVECFIAPNNWISNAGASIFRNKVIQDTQIIQFIDFGNFKVFTSGIQTMVYLLKKSKVKEKYNLLYSKLLEDSIDSKELYHFLYFKTENSYFSKYVVEFDRKEFKDEYITLLRKELTDVLDKIKGQGNFFLNKKEVAQGIVAPQENLNKSNAKKLNNQFPLDKGIFVLNNNEKNNLNLNKEELEIIKPYYTTDEISRYRFLPSNKYWIIYTRSDIKNKIRRFPNIKNHLDNFKKIITSDNRPYGLHRAREERFFKGTKIISLRKCFKPSFTLVDEDSYVSQTFFLIKTDRVDMKYLIGILNSRLIAFWLYYKGKLQGNLYQIDYAPIVKTPIKKVDNRVNDNLIRLVDQILSITKDDDYMENPDKQVKVNGLEKEIDQLVYELYDLTPEEIKIVEEFDEKSRVTSKKRTT